MDRINLVVVYLERGCDRINALVKWLFQEIECRVILTSMGNWFGRGFNPDC